MLLQWASIGTSDDPCSETYHGSAPFSEVEMRNIRDYVTPKKDALVYFIDVHSYSQLVILPWGYTDEACPNFDEMLDVFKRANEALFSVHGTEYEVGNAHDTIYPTSGTARDWGKGVPQVKYTTGMELRDTGEHGFLLPEDQIIPNSEEVWAFQKSVAMDMIRKER
jgi:carboxypeptidase A4